MSKKEKTRLLCHLGFHKWVYVARYECVCIIPDSYGWWNFRGMRCKHCMVNR